MLGIILAAIMAAAGVYIKILKLELSAEKSQNAALAIKFDIASKSVTTLSTSIDMQNTAIEKLKTAADARVASHAKEIAIANQQANIFKHKAEDIMNRQAPPNKSSCDAANDLINEELPE